MTEREITSWLRVAIEAIMPNAQFCRTRYKREPCSSGVLTNIEIRLLEPAEEWTLEGNVEPPDRSLDMEIINEAVAKLKLLRVAREKRGEL